MRIRNEKKDDYDHMNLVHEFAFNGKGVSKPVEKIRKTVTPCISLDSENEIGNIIEHIMFSPIIVESYEKKILMRLASIDDFMIIELSKGNLSGVTGVVKYHPVSSGISS